ncbi:MAG: tetratricopeptide repeat protein [Hydrogenophaga sp.]
MRLPAGWDTAAHRLWDQGQASPACQTMVSLINAAAKQKAPPSVSHLEQFGYYLWRQGRFAEALQMQERAHQIAPERIELTRNLAVLYNRNRRHEDAVRTAQTVLTQLPDDAVSLDVLSSALRRLDRTDEARSAGTRALQIKAQRTETTAPPVSGWALPEQRPNTGQHQIEGKPNVIAFSIWGSQPRYLRGALRNLLVAPGLFPGWTLRFSVDATVPPGFTALLRELGAEVDERAAGASLREKLCWRFDVANDPTVGYFLVRDADSVISAREAQLVNEWLDGSAHFHLIRDWWTHTDLILAGMWGGVAGVLPPLKPLLGSYQSQLLETPNIDQWFLRDRVWPLVRTSLCQHDRLFDLPGTTRLSPPPAGSPANLHIGQDEHTARRDEQASLLAHWIRRFDWLSEPNKP